MSVFTAQRGLDLVNDQLAYRVMGFLEKAKEEFGNGEFGVKGIMVTESYRSYLRQKYLWAFGRYDYPGTPENELFRPKVTWTMHSSHQNGLAVDVAFLDLNGNPTYKGPWSRLGEIGESCGLLWGGRWTTPDRPHFELNPNWQKEHWAYGAQKTLMDSGKLKYEKDLNGALTRGEAYQIFLNILEL